MVVGEADAVVIPSPNTRSNIKVAKLQIFDRVVSKVLGFLTVYKLFIRMKIREAVAKEQI